MKKVFTLIAAALMAVSMSAESYTPTVKMTYVDWNNPDTSYGEVTSASTGYNTFTNGTVGFGLTRWNVNYITYIEVDASGLPEEATITAATLTATVTGSDRGHTFNIGYNSSKWSDTLTYNNADKTATSLNSTLSVSATSGSSASTTGNFIITDAFKSNKKVTLLIWDTSAGGGTVSNVSASITYTTEKTSEYYVVRELDEENQLDTITYNGIVVGTEVAPTSDDIAAFYKDGVKYVYVSGAENSIVVDEDKDKNYIHVTFKEADIINYTIMSNLGEELDYGNSYVGDAVKYAYPRYQESEGVLYQSSVNNKEYTNTFTPTATNSVAVVNYTTTNKENIVYLNEGEYIDGFTETTTGNLPVRGSNGKGGVTTDSVTITTLPAGKYVMVVGAFTSKTSQQNLDFTLGGNTYTASSSGNLSENTSSEFTLTNETNDVVFIGSTSSADAQLDYIYIQKTGDYNYLTLESTLPDSITFTEGEDITAFDINAYLTVNTNAEETAKYLYIATAEGDVTKEDANYAPVTSNEQIVKTLSQPGTYYMYGAVFGVFADATDATVLTDTVVVVIKEKEAEEEHTFSFTNWSEATIANLKADAAASKLVGWSDVEKKATAESDGEPTELSKDNCFWFAGTANDDGQLEANGEVIEELKGLTFPTASYNSARSIAIAVNYKDLQVYDEQQAVTGNAGFGPYNGASYLWLGGSGKDCFIIKNVKVGTTITMGVESHKLTDARGVKLSVNGVELKDPDGDPVVAPTTYTEQTWAVTAEEGPGAKAGVLSTNDDDEVVDVLVSNTYGCHIYYIDAEIGETTPTAVSVVEADASVKAEGKFIENGKIIIVKGGKKYNAAGAQVK